MIKNDLSQRRTGLNPDPSQNYDLANDIAVILMEIADDVVNEIISTGKCTKNEYVQQVAEITDVYIDQIVDAANMEHESREN